MGVARLSVAPTCLRCTFVEQVPSLTERHQQASTELRSRLRAVAAELGGRVGPRLCRKLSVPGGRMRLRSPSGEAFATKPSFSISRADGRSTSFRTGPPRRWPLGCTITLGSRWCAVSGPVPMPAPSKRPPRRQSRWQIADSCCATSRSRWRRPAMSIAPACRSMPNAPSGQGPGCRHRRPCRRP